MSERYKIIFSLDESLNSETTPAIIKAGALVLDSEKRKLHIQLKFQNLGDRAITRLKARIIFMDSMGRALGETEKQYLDLNIENGIEFGGKIPIAVNKLATRKFDAFIEEVCFSDGDVWRNEDVKRVDFSKPDALNKKEKTKKDEERAKRIKTVATMTTSLLLPVFGILAFLFPVIEFKGIWSGREAINGFALLKMDSGYFYAWTEILLGILAWIHLIGCVILIVLNLISCFKKRLNKKLVLSTLITMPLIGIMYLVKGIVSVSLDSEVTTLAYLPLIFICFITIIGVYLLLKSKNDTNV